MFCPGCKKIDVSRYFEPIQVKPIILPAAPSSHAPSVSTTQAQPTTTPLLLSSKTGGLFVFVYDMAGYLFIYLFVYVFIGNISSGSSVQIMAKSYGGIMDASTRLLLLIPLHDVIWIIYAHFNKTMVLVSIMLMTTTMTLTMMMVMMSGSSSSIIMIIDDINVEKI